MNTTIVTQEPTQAQQGPWRCPRCRTLSSGPFTEDNEDGFCPDCWTQLQAIAEADAQQARDQAPQIVTVGFESWAPPRAEEKATAFFQRYQITRSNIVSIHAAVTPYPDNSHNLTLVFVLDVPAYVARQIAEEQGR